MLSLKEYKEIIDLNYRPRPAAELTEEEKSVICDEMLGVLLEERNEIAAFSYPYRVKRDLIWGYLNERMPNPVSSRFLEIQDKLFRAESVERGVVDVSSLDYREGIALWQGDITRLNADAIVNAANNSLLGCFIPHHKCIDNVIHSRAGVQVRLDCSKIMGAQGEAEPSGCAKITLAYNLPSKYILHTVGPMVGVRVTDEDRRVLRNCYISCLNLAREMGLHTVAFCCISTGEFGFPNEPAAQIAVSTVCAHDAVREKRIEVIFNVFKEQDEAIYKRLLCAED